MKVGKRYKIKQGLITENDLEISLKGELLTVTHINSLYIQVKVDGKDCSYAIYIHDWEKLTEPIDFKPVKNIPQFSLTV